MKALYDSPWHIPLLPTVAGAILLLGLLRTRTSLRTFLAIFTLEILADAWLTGPLSPLTDGTAAATVASVAFVVLGDLRFFALRERYAPSSQRWSRAGIARAMGLSLVVPVASAVVSRACVAASADSHATFLIYEALFASLVAGLLLASPRPTTESARFLRRLAALEGLQYAGWACADVAILSGASWGYGLRILPNVLYYAAFLPWVAAFAPRDGASS